MGRVEEGDGFAREGLVVLEDAAVARIPVEDEFRVRQPPGQILGVDARHHDVPVPVRDQDGVSDPPEVLRGLPAPGVDRLQLRQHHPDAHVLAAIRRALLQAFQKRLRGVATGLRRCEEQEGLRIAESQNPLQDERPRHAAHPVDADAAGGAGPGQDHPPDKVGLREDHLLGHEPAEGEPEQVDAVQPEGPDDRDRVAGHRRHGGRNLAPGGADSAVIDGDDRAAPCQTLDDAGVEIVEIGPPMVQQDHRHAGRRPEPPIGEGRARRRDGAVRSVGPARRRIRGRDEGLVHVAAPSGFTAMTTLPLVRPDSISLIARSVASNGTTRSRTGRRMPASILAVISASWAPLARMYRNT